MAEVQTPAVSSFKDTALLILSIIAILERDRRVLLV